MDITGRYSATRRVLRLLRLLRERPREHAELLAELGISAVQLERDLALLREEGLAVREHGGRGRGHVKLVWTEGPAAQ